MILRAFFCLFACLTLPLSAQDPLPETFAIEGRTAYLQAAPQPAEGRPWVWYAPTLRSLAFGERRAYFEIFLRRASASPAATSGRCAGHRRARPSSRAFTRRWSRAAIRPSQSCSDRVAVG